MANIESIKESKEEELDSKDRLIRSPKATLKTLGKLKAPSLTIGRLHERPSRHKTKNESNMRLKEIEARLFESEKN